MSKIFVWIKDPGRPPRHVWVENKLENLQKLVGGYIESFQVASNMTILCNEDGKLNGLEPNVKIMGKQFVGPIIFVGVSGDEFCDCPADKTAMRTIFPQLWRKEG